MSAAAVASFAMELIKDLPTMVSAGLDIASTVTNGVKMLENMKSADRGPTNEEYEALRALNAELHRQFQALGAAGDGDSAGTTSSTTTNPG